MKILCSLALTLRTALWLLVVGFALGVAVGYQVAEPPGQVAHSAAVVQPDQHVDGVGRPSADIGRFGANGPVRLGDLAEPDRRQVGARNGIAERASPEVGSRPLDNLGSIACQLIPAVRLVGSLRE